MKFWQGLVIILVCLAVLVAGLGIAAIAGFEWVGPIATAFSIGGAGIGTLIVKKRGQAKNRSMMEGSVERREYERASAASHGDALVMVALGMAFSVFQPNVPGWIIMFLVLAVLAISYWIRLFFVRRTSRGDS